MATVTDVIRDTGRDGVRTKGEALHKLTLRVLVRVRVTRVRARVWVMVGDR